LKGLGKLPVAILCIATLVHATFVFLTSYPKTLNARLDNLIDFNQNWDSLPIIDIKAVDGDCEAGYESIIKSKWPGMNPGCYCKDLLKIGIDNMLESNECGKN
jgi:hypothetical protein